MFAPTATAMEISRRNVPAPGTPARPIQPSTPWVADVVRLDRTTEAIRTSPSMNSTTRSHSLLTTRLPSETSRRQINRSDSRQTPIQPRPDHARPTRAMTLAPALAEAISWTGSWPARPGRISWIALETESLTSGLTATA